MTLSSLLRSLLPRTTPAAPSRAVLGLAHFSSFSRGGSGGGDRRRGGATEEDDPFDQDFDFGPDGDDTFNDQGRGRGRDRRGGGFRENAPARGRDFGGDGDMSRRRHPRDDRDHGFNERPMRGDGRNSGSRRPDGDRDFNDRPMRGDGRYSADRRQNGARDGGFNERSMRGDGRYSGNRRPEGNRDRNFTERPMRGDGRYSGNPRPDGDRIDGRKRMGNSDASKFSRSAGMNDPFRKETRWNTKDDNGGEFLSLEKLGMLSGDDDDDLESSDLGEKVLKLGGDESVDQTFQPTSVLGDASKTSMLGDASKTSMLGDAKNDQGKEKKSLRECLIQAQEEADKEANAGPPPEAEEIFKKMKETGLIPNAVAMLDGLCKDGLVKEAMKLFGLMREKGTIPEVVVYTAVVEGFCKAEKFDDAKRVFRKMQSNDIVPNAFSYRVLVQGLCKGKKLEESVDFAVEMLEAGHLPSPATFVGLVDLACTERGGEGAASVIERLRDKGFAYDDKAVREHLDKKGPFNHVLREAILGRKSLHKLF